MIVKLVEIGVDMNAPHGIKHARSQGVIDFAYRIARDAHSGQERKYTHDPYIVHPVAVARTVASVTEDCEMISAALLHDVIEDTPFTFEQIKDSVLGYRVADIVRELTNFAKVFMREMAALLDVLVRGDERLLERADEIVEYYL
jgi:(p)ppGpp synthase/HD superfamily hydrolase